MSPQIAPARMYFSPVSTGCALLSIGALTIATTTTTTTITTGSGWVSVRE